MKARVLSLILLLAMLITAIPVMATAVEEDEATVLPPSVIPSYLDAHDLYVQDGLVALFSGFDSKSYDFGSGIWQNKVAGGENATFRDAETPYWEAQNGGIGYTMLPAEWNADGHKVGVSLPDAYEHMDNYTVEAFATVVGITNENGDRYVNDDLTGHPYGWYKSSAKASSAFRFGLITTLFFCSLMSNNAADDSIGARWFVCNGPYAGGNPSDPYGHVIVNEASWRKMGATTVPTAGVMQMHKTTADETVDDVTVTNVTHRLAYNNSASYLFTETFTKEAEANYLKQTHANFVDHSGRFSLFNALPSTVYSIRVYDRELTAAEKTYNRGVDVMLYYGIELPADLRVSHHLR